jgi:hypothetical protein
MIRSFRDNQRGNVVFLSLIYVLISLGFTVSYLQFVMGERFIFMRHLAESRAKYNAHYGLAAVGNPFVQSPLFTSPDTTLDGEAVELMRGRYRDINCRYGKQIRGSQYELLSNATGESEFNGIDGKPIIVEYIVGVSYLPDTFAKYMYFTNEETPGGGPWLGPYVVFGGGEDLEGIVYSNDNISMSNFSCPSFVEGPDGQESEVYTAGTFIMGTCSESIFSGTYEDSMPKIDWPPFTGQDRVRANADYVYYSDAMINGLETYHDTLIMTEIEFFPGYFTVKSWPYVIPPFESLTPLAGPDYYTEYLNKMRMFYPLHYRNSTFDGGAFTGDEEFSHWDFADFPMPTNNTNDLITNDIIYTDEAVIWIQGGQVRVKGQVQGRYTVATSGPTNYRMHHDNQTIATMKNNIWIVDDLVYQDSNPMTGAVASGSTYRMGLLSGGNVIIANSKANGARNQTYGSDVKINAAIIAMDESFLVQYWQNTTGGGAFETEELVNSIPNTDPFWFLDGTAIKGDGQAPKFFGRNSSNGSDQRGTIHLYGSIIQSKRGYVRRNNPGPYTATIGYDKNYNYDYNLREYPPPSWPENRTADGERSLTMTSIGEIKTQ